MRIAFFALSCIPFHGRTLEERPLGGTETAVARLAEALVDRGHEVVVFTEVDNPPLTSVLYLPFRAFGQLGAVDVAVMVRDWKLLLLPVECRKRCFWTGDSYDQFHTVGLGDRRVAERIDLLLTVSDWHSASLSAASGFPPERCWPVRNGVHLPHFEGSESRERRRLFYSSMPYRGLRRLPRLYRRILEAEPESELHVFSGYEVYASGVEPPPEAVRELEAIRKEFAPIPRVQCRGNLPQRALAREMMRAAILAYPNTFEETSCITAMEAKAAGCAVVTSARAALVETVGEEGGALIRGEPGSPDYDDAFVAAVVELLRNDARFQEVSSRNRSEAFTRLGWTHRAERFEERLLELLGA